MARKLTCDLKEGMLRSWRPRSRQPATDVRGDVSRLDLHLVLYHDLMLELMARAWAVVGVSTQVITPYLLGDLEYGLCLQRQPEEDDGVTAWSQPRR